MTTSGPYVTELTGASTLNGADYRSSYMLQRKWKSKPRQHVAPLPYLRRRAQSFVRSAGSRRNGGNTPADCVNFGAMPMMDSSTHEAVLRCKQAAYSKLVGQVKANQMLWQETLAQRKKTFAMMLHRISTLTNAARRLKKGDIPGFVRALGVSPRRTRSKLRKASDAWLEYHFGWEPLIRDIYRGCVMLTGDVPAMVTRAASAENLSLVRNAAEHKAIGTARVIVKYQGTYYVDNPNKFLLNQAGLINPAALAWELMPFSFVVDWFIPVEQFLLSYTDFWGVGRKDEFTTVFRQAEAWQESIPLGIKTEWSYTIQSRAILMERTLGIDVPRPTFKLYKGFSLIRGATAVALLIGMLRSLK